MVVVDSSAAVLSSQYYSITKSGFETTAISIVSADTVYVILKSTINANTYQLGLEVIDLTGMQASVF